MMVTGQLHYPAVLLSGKVKRLNMPQSRPGRYGEKKKFLLLRGIEPLAVELGFDRGVPTPPF
jgi:hypothetical protein